MATLTNPSRHFSADMDVVPLTTVQLALWEIGMPVLGADSVAEHKKRAKWGMLWRAMRWLLAGVAALVGLMCLGRQWGRAAAVGAAAVVLVALFTWLLSAYDLQWVTTGYRGFRALQAVPAHVSAAVDALVSRGVSEKRIGVEYLKDDPILFVEDDEHASPRRYDLIIW